jgi:hypothetical protein
MREMIEVNAREALGEVLAGSFAFLDDYRGPFEDAPAHAIDGRMMPHEWLRTAGGYVKTDAADHHADHFFPGPQNVAWDAAGAALELGVEIPAAALPFYLTAYAAFRLGYVTMAAEALEGSADGRRFGALVVRRGSQLRALLASKGRIWHE